MGGCKCSYRNCTAKTNGQIHLFHYPVFDRPRCHKWLVNGHRQDFLNLKVSQLKNRVVCQHHFKDDDFMNINKEKLKPTAVPTLNGPYCDPSEWDKEEEEDKFDQIDLEDIENDLYLNYDKKDCFSRKYGNFLSNSDLVDLDFSNNIKSSAKKKDSLVCIIRNPTKQSIRKRQLNFEELIRTPKQYFQSYKSPKVSKVEIISDEKVDMKIIPDPAALEPVKYNTVLPLPKRQSKAEQCTREIVIPPQEITLEKKGTNEVTATSELNSINQNITENISLPTEETDSKTFEVPVIDSEKLQFIDLGPSDQLNIIKTQNFEDEQPTKIIDLQDNKVKTKAKITKQYQPLNCQKISVLKNKMCSKRLSEIQQKRNFNKKLTDLISSQLIQEKEKLSNVNEIMQNAHNMVSSEIITTNTKTSELPNSVKSHLSEDKSLLSENYYSIAVLEQRMKKMEQMLLQKMEHNTRMVLNLKQSLENKVSTTFKAETTQTALDEESHKKYLYHEISKYLSPEANNCIYEELFINKFEPKRLKLRR